MDGCHGWVLWMGVMGGCHGWMIHMVAELHGLMDGMILYATCFTPKCSVSRQETHMNLPPPAPYRNH